jgi:lipoprotein-anchoring transpeptidase ErfK/SrfK
MAEAVDKIEIQELINEDITTRKLKRKKKRKIFKIVMGITVSLCTVTAAYTGIGIYFKDHFYYGSEINSINVSGKSVQEVNELMAAELQKYTLNLKERGGKNELITASEIGLKYNSDGKFENLKNEQNPFMWISSVFNKEGYKMTEGITLDKKKLQERLDKLSCFDSKNIIEPKDASIKHEDNRYMIVEEVDGNKVNKDILYEHMVKAVLNKEAAIDLEEIDCYVKPQLTSSSPKIVEASDKLNKYVSSKITYTFGERKEVIDASTINEWLTFDKNYVVTFDEEKMKDYVKELFRSYNTVGTTRKFVTASRKTIRISGGDYGWWVNTSKEIEYLSTALKEGQVITKEPAYTRKAFSYRNNINDIGNTYVEIDLTKQHLWFYKNGKLIVQGNVVTGNVSQNNTTPKGIYILKYKKRNAVLRGDDYATPVKYWMPFNGGIGIHDASWRSVFGGGIYLTNGSHGCVNSPEYVAKTIFNNIKEGTPIICY